MTALYPPSSPRCGPQAPCAPPPPRPARAGARPPPHHTPQPPPRSPLQRAAAPCAPPRRTPTRRRAVPPARAPRRPPGASSGGAVGRLLGAPLGTVGGDGCCQDPARGRQLGMQAAPGPETLLGAQRLQTSLEWSSRPQQRHPARGQAAPLPMLPSCPPLPGAPPSAAQTPPRPLQPHSPRCQRPLQLRRGPQRAAPRAPWRWRPVGEKGGGGREAKGGAPRAGTQRGTSTWGRRGVSGRALQVLDASHAAAHQAHRNTAQLLWCPACGQCPTAHLRRLQGPQLPRALQPVQLELHAASAGGGLH